MSQQHKSFFSFPFDSFVWKVMPDAVHSLLILELRDENSRKTFFSGIDLSEHAVLWEQATLEEKWWLSLFQVSEGKVFLHGYKDYKNPQRQGIYVLEEKTGKLLWSNASIIPLIVTRKGIVVKEESEDRWSLLDIESGKFIKQLEENEVSSCSVELQEDLNHSYLQRPHYYSSENPFFQKLSTFIAIVAKLEPILAIEYFEYQNKIIASFYFKKGENLVNYLLVANEEGKCLYLEAIGNNLKGISPDSFFLLNDRLIFIKNRKELIIFEL